MYKVPREGAEALEAWGFLAVISCGVVQRHLTHRGRELFTFEESLETLMARVIRR